MFDLFLNAARFIVSEDVRKSASSIIDLIRRSPEWQRDMCSLEAKISRQYSEQTSIFSGLTLSKMGNLEYSKAVQDSFQTAYSEIIRNAFEHACRTNAETIHILIDITREYVALTVRNPRGRKLDLESLLGKSRSTLAGKPSNPRGRGLLLVNELADTFVNTEKRDGVKAVFYRERFSVNIKNEGDVTIIKLTGGLHNPSLQRRLFAIASRYLNNNLILDFSGWVAGTYADFVILSLDELYAKSDKQIVAILDSRKEYGDESEVILPDAVVARSLEEALAKLSRSALINRLESKANLSKNKNAPRKKAG